MWETSWSFSTTLFCSQSFVGFLPETVKCQGICSALPFEKQMYFTASVLHESRLCIPPFSRYKVTCLWHCILRLYHPASAKFNQRYPWTIFNLWTIHGTLCLLHSWKGITNFSNRYYLDITRQNSTQSVVNMPPPPKFDPFHLVKITPKLEKSFQLWRWSGYIIIQNLQAIPSMRSPGNTRKPQIWPVSLSQKGAKIRKISRPRP